MGALRCRSGLWVLILVVVLLGICEIGSVVAQNRRPKNVQVAVRAKWSGTPLLLEAGYVYVTSFCSSCSIVFGC